MKPLNFYPLTKKDLSNKKIGSQLQWRYNKITSVKLETINKKDPRLLTAIICLTFQDDFVDEITSWQYNCLWGKTEKRIKKIFKEKILPDDNILIVTYPEFKPKYATSMRIKPKASVKKHYVIIEVTFNNQYKNWKKEWVESLNNFADLCRVEIEDLMIAKNI